MSVNIFKLEEEDMPKVLGEDDWHIFIADDKPDLIVTRQFRQKYLDDIAKCFVRWVKEAKDRVISHHNDPHYDSSGSIRTSEADPIMLLIRHETLEGWLKEEYTGYSQASYVSGSGLYWETYDEKWEDDLQSSAFYLVRDAICSYLGIDNPADIDVEDYDEYDSYELIDILIVVALKRVVYAHQTKDIWEKYEADVQNEIEQERIEYQQFRQHRQHMIEQARYFWSVFFAEESNMKLETPEFHRLGIEEKLRNILPDTDPEIVKAIAEIGWLGDCSNSVGIAIKKIAEEALI